MKNEEILKDFQKTRGLKESSIKRYEYALLKYSEFHQKTLNDLLEEAENEEDEGIRLRKRKIKERLKQFKANLIKENYSPQTISISLAHVKTFYKTYEIEIPLISNKVDNNNLNHETVEDIPTTEHVKIATQTNNLRNNALILFMSSSGTASAETRNLSIGDFIKATNEYHNSDNLKDVLNELNDIEGIIPTWHMTRIKTNYPYYTFNSPEATEAIIKYLETRPNAKKREKLFPMGERYLSKIFNRINHNNGWGYKETRCFFHSHALRKFFATELMKAGLDFLKIQWMSGRHVDSTTEAYFKADPSNLKQEYLKVVDNLSVNKVKINEITTEDKKELEKMKSLLAEKDKSFEDYKKQQENEKSKMQKEITEEVIKEFSKIYGKLPPR
nr:tyrosine-type recombinase/integrase [Methanobrevibacter arboriphilus]